jgi:thioredoxin reductase
MQSITRRASVSETCPLPPRSFCEIHWYWASALEAKLCAGEEVAIIGVGNSAGQAAVFLANHASRVHMLIRGEGRMSRYLIDRIAASPAIELHPKTEVIRSLAVMRGAGLH